MALHAGAGRGPGHLNRLPQGSGGGGGPVSAITALTVIGPTLVDATGDYGDATARTGVPVNGWVGKVTVPYLVGQTFDPTKISLTVTDPGYDGTTTTTVTRTVTGTRIIRRQYSANASLQQANDGVTLTVYFGLSGMVFQGSTVTAAAAAASFYGASAAGSVSSITNSSTAPYEKPTFGWLNLQHERQTGSFSVEAVAYHPSMRSGRQVARIEFIAKDSQGTPNVAATQTAGSTSPSTLQTQGQIVDAYKATIPLTALTQGDLCFVNAKVYPWIGDSTAVLDLINDGVSVTGNVSSPNPQTPLRFVCDKTGAYGGAFAAVKPGASGNTVQSTLAGALATPYGTWNAALAAIKVYNNANKGHNDHSGGTIAMMESSLGAGANHSTANSGIAADVDTVTAGKCLTMTIVDPNATGAVKMTMATTRASTSMLHFKINIDHTAGNGLDGGSAANSNVLALDGFTLNTTGNAGAVPLNYRNGLTYVRNVSQTTGGDTNGQTEIGCIFSNNRMAPALMLGVICTDAAVNVKLCPYVLVGCSFKRFNFDQMDSVTLTNTVDNDAAVITNNKFLDCRTTNSWAEYTDVVRGVGFVQNVVEPANKSTAVPAVQFGADGQVKAMNKFFEAYNTVPGVGSESRVNANYTDVAGAAAVTKRGRRIANLYGILNMKSDPFTVNTSVTGRVGNWEYRHWVGDFGNVIIGGSSNGDITTSTDGASWLGDTPNGNVMKAGTANVTFTDDKSGPTGVGLGSGTYTLTGATNAAYDAVPAGMAGLATDLNGVARKNDGHGAAGAYERTV